MTLTDDYGREVKAGDMIAFTYGVPLVGVVASVIERGGRLIALTPGHNPCECRVDRLRYHVGEFHIQHKETNG